MTIRRLQTSSGQMISCQVTGNDIIALESSIDGINQGDQLRVTVEGSVSPMHRMETRAEMLERTRSLRPNLMSASGSALVNEVREFYAGTASFGWSYPPGVADYGPIIGVGPDGSGRSRDYVWSEFHRATVPREVLTIPEPPPTPTVGEFQDPPERFEDRTREDMVVMEDGVLTRTFRKLKLKLKHVREEPRDVIIDD